jgi:hypothetical protein
MLTTSPVALTSFSASHWYNRHRRVSVSNQRTLEVRCFEEFRDRN